MAGVWSKRKGWDGGSRTVGDAPVRSGCICWLLEQVTSSGQHACLREVLIFILWSPWAFAEEIVLHCLVQNHLMQNEKLSCLSAASGNGRRDAEAGGQQDRVRPPGICPGPETELRSSAGTVSWGIAGQGLHVQLGAKVHEHYHQPWRWKLPPVHKGRFWNCPEKVSVSLKAWVLNFAHPNMINPPPPPPFPLPPPPSIPRRSALV